MYKNAIIMIDRNSYLKNVFLFYFILNILIYSIWLCLVLVVACGI